MNIPFLDTTRFARQHADALTERLHNVVQSGQYVLGRQLAALEQELASWLDCPYTVGVGSGTDALHLALLAAGVGPGDEVITTPFSFAATIGAIQYTGATAVLADIDPDSWNLCPDAAAAAVTARSRALLPVHLFGLPADLDALDSLARKGGLALIEDAAQSFGARHRQRHTGTVGQFGAFSFYPSKTLGGFGDAGLVSCSDAAGRNRLLQLRNHGIVSPGEHGALGYNSRLDELQAAVLRYRLPQLAAAIERRNAIARRYREALADRAARCQATPEHSSHAMGYFTLWVADRDDLRAQLAAAGIGTALYYGRALHQQPAFRDSCRYGALPNAEQAAAHCLSLPMFPELTDGEVDYICDQLRRCLPR